MKKSIVAMVLALSMILCSYPALAYSVDSDESRQDGILTETSVVDADTEDSPTQEEPGFGEGADEDPAQEASESGEGSEAGSGEEASTQESAATEDSMEGPSEQEKPETAMEAEPVQEDSGTEHAAEKQPSSASHEGEPVTLLSLMEKKQEEEPYEAHTALVMLRTGKKLTRKKAREALRQNESGVQDLEVQEVYSFGQRQTTVIGGKTQAYSSVCLVKSNSLTTKQLVRTLNKQDDVLYAEPNYRVHACNVDDSYFRFQWSMQGGTPGTSDYNENTPNVTTVWDRGTTGTEAIVAVVDTGVNYKHPDLAGNMWHNTHQPELAGKYGFDFINGDSDPMDENGHGTHCAGIIGAQGNNGIGISGVNQRVRIMALRTLNSDGSAWLSHEVAAYHYINQALDLGEPIRAINNSWGGGLSSKIFEELINIVGEKGAITCCAAGNDSNNNDENPYYPSGIMSPYKLTVAAATEDGQLAGFSNYGKESVDVAAPGTDILSAVSYDCYNPTIYGSKQASISAEYNDYESGASSWGSVTQLKDNLYLNGEPYDRENSKAKISISSVKDGVLNSKGGAAEIDVKNMKAKDIICMTLPYELGKDAVTAPSCSFMVRSEVSRDECAVFGVLDAPQGTNLDTDTIDDFNLGAGRNLYKNSFDRWSHMFFQTLTDEELQTAFDEVNRAKESGKALEQNPLKREIVIVLYATENCDAKIHLDDLGLSRQDLADTDVFEQYDFYCGTSMATPFITGAAALLAAEAEKSGEPLDPGVLVGKIVSMTKGGSMPVAAGGVFDFTKLSEHLRPWIGKILADKSGGSITIRGMGLNPADGLTVQLGKDSEKEMQTAEIATQTDTELVVKDNKWINNVVNIRVTDADGHSTGRSNYYLVSGKQNYTAVENVSDTTVSGPLATDGRYVYSVEKYNDGTIHKLDTKDLKNGSVSLSEIEPSKLFDMKKDPNAEYAMAVSDDLVYLNGKLYTVVEYGKADLDERAFFEEENQTNKYAIYSGESRLVSVDTATGKVENLGALPTELKNTTDYTMAAYNGRLYFLGGYSYESADLTDRVKIYDPAKATNRWSDGTPLPEARAHGKALQSGNRLIYTMGWSAPVESDSDMENYHCPGNLILNGKQWSRSSMEPEKNIMPFYCTELVTRGDKQYPIFNGCVSAAKNGLIYTGILAEDYGDTFVYDVSTDAYLDTGYQFFTDLNDARILRGIVVGDSVYGFDGSNVHTARASESALVPIKVEKNTGGTVSGATEVMPGNDAVLKVKAKKGYVIKTIKVDGKTVAVDRNSVKKTITIKNVTEAHGVKVVFAKQNLSITVKYTKGGTVSGPKKIQSGGSAVYKVKAKKGYVIKSITVDAKTIAVKKNATQKTVVFKNLVENHTMRVAFQKKTK